MSACISVRMEQPASQGTNILQNLKCEHFRKSVEKIRVSLKSDKNNGYFTLISVYIYDNISLKSS